MNTLRILSVVFAFLVVGLASFAQQSGMMQQEIPDVELIIGIDILHMEDLSQNLSAVNNVGLQGEQSVDNQENSTVDGTFEREDEKDEDAPIETEPIMIKVKSSEIIYNDKNVRLYPNPAITNAKFETNSDEYHTLEIYNLIGNLVLTQSIENNYGVNYININMLSNGIYMLHFVGNSIISTKKLVVK